MTKELTILVKPGTSKIMAMIIEEESLAEPCWPRNLPGFPGQLYPAF
jgi:hypothetical protein